MALKDHVKDGIEIIGLIPTVLGFFKAPPEFAPSPSLGPWIVFVPTILSALTFMATWIYFMKVKGPPTQWSPQQLTHYFWVGTAGIAGFLIFCGAYYSFLRLDTYSNTGADLTQAALWAGIFATVTFTLTTFACFLKRP